MLGYRGVEKFRGWTGLLAVACAGMWLGDSPPALAAPMARPCASNRDNRALDFWLGRWTIAAPGGTRSASSKVTVDLDQCLVVERWDGGRGHIGENLFAYSADDEGWHGLFADNEGRVHVFLDGKASPGLLQFTGPSRGPGGESVLNRVTIRRLGASHVEQQWEKSSDGGKTWTTAFRGEYTRKQP